MAGNNEIGIDPNASEMLAGNVAYVERALQPRERPYTPVRHPAVTKSAFGWERASTGSQGRLTDVARPNTHRAMRYQQQEPNPLAAALGAFGLLIARGVIFIAIITVPLALAIQAEPSLLSVGNPFAALDRALAGAATTEVNH